MLWEKRKRGTSGDRSVARSRDGSVARARRVGGSAIGAGDRRRVERGRPGRAPRRAARGGHAVHARDGDKTRSDGTWGEPARGAGAPRAPPRRIGERRVPGGELLRDDGGHLDFRLMCLKLLVCAGMARDETPPRALLLHRELKGRCTNASHWRSEEMRDSAKQPDCLPYDLAFT